MLFNYCIVVFRHKISSLALKQVYGNKHDWTYVKYLNVLHHKRTQKQPATLFAKILPTLFICMQKINSFPNFWNIVKILQIYYFEHFQDAWSGPAVIVSPCKHPWCPKCWNQFVGNLDVYLHAKINFISNFFFEIL